MHVLLLVLDPKKAHLIYFLSGWHQSIIQALLYQGGHACPPKNSSQIAYLLYYY